MGKKDRPTEAADNAGEPKESRKHRKDGHVDTADSAPQQDVVKSKKTSKKVSTEQLSQDTANKEKKEKRKRDSEENDVAVEEPVKKKSKNKTGFPDPYKDDALPEQAKKALGYAFTQFRHPTRWKFHKARQNWIVRNMWSQSVPEQYMPLVLKYLANVQGATKKNLLQRCKTTLQAEVTPPEQPAQKDAASGKDGAVDSSPPPNKSDEMRRVRARALLEAIDSVDTQTADS